MHSAKHNGTENLNTKEDLYESNYRGHRYQQGSMMQAAERQEMGVHAKRYNSAWLSSRPPTFHAVCSMELNQLAQLNMLLAIFVRS